LKARLRKIGATLFPRQFAARDLSRRRNRINTALAANYSYDRDRFAGASAVHADARDIEQLGSLIMMDCHRIEKGLALPKPRAGFGVKVIERLLRDIPQHEARHGLSLPTQSARKALKEYLDYCRRHGVAAPGGVKELLFSAPAPNCEAGTIEVTRKSILDAIASGDFGAFARHRYSVRQFTGQPIMRNDIEEAVLIAMKSPSVCNRQSAKVYSATTPDTIAKVLSYQNGNAGFGDTLGAVFVVTSDMRIFNSIGERNQCWVDGGIFAMSLVYALHGLGLGACMLNWSQTMEQDQAMRRAFNIPDHEAVITMIGAGQLPETLRVAVSPRRDCADVLRMLD
jgi:nitroreductase